MKYIYTFTETLKCALPPSLLPWAYWILGCVDHIVWRVGIHCCVCGYTRAQQTLTQVIIRLDSLLSSPITSLKHLSVAIVMYSILCLYQNFIQNLSS